MNLRVAYLVAGAGGMYCGSCLRDNRLAATLIQQGRDVTLLPLYTPIRTDEKNVSAQPVHYGGVNAFLQQTIPIFRRTPRFIDALFDAQSFLNLVGRFASSANPEKLGAMTVSVLQGHDGAQRKQLHHLIQFLKSFKPDLINLPNLMFLGAAPALKQSLGVPIVCALAGEDIFLDAIPEPHRSQAFSLIKRHASHIDAFIAPTQYYADHCARHFQIPTNRVRHIPMGIRLEGYENPAPHDLNTPLTIGYLARICPEKGLDQLVDAWITIRNAGLPAKLRVAGYLGKTDKRFFNNLIRKIANAGHHADFDHIGSPDLPGKIDFLRSLHLLSAPTRYPESKGFYILEALAAGVPVVQPAHGSFPELITATGGGLLYDPNAPTALVDALATLANDPDQRTALGAAGRESVHRRYNDRVMADATWNVYESLFT